MFLASVEPRNWTKRGQGFFSTASRKEHSDAAPFLAVGDPRRTSNLRNCKAKAVSSYVTAFMVIGYSSNRKLRPSPFVFFPFTWARVWRVRYNHVDEDNTGEIRRNKPKSLVDYQSGSRQDAEGTS